MKQGIASFHTDQEGHWVAELVCGHFQHVRHDPPWTNRPWTQTAGGRQKMVGKQLNCVKCDTGQPRDALVTKA